MKTTLSLAALALFATSLVAPMQANAADRQISVNGKKLQTFTVNDRADDSAAVVEENLAEPQKASGAEPDKTIEFSVKNDEQPAEFKVGNDEQAAIEVAAVTPEQPRAKVKPKAFRVDPEPAANDEASNDDNSGTPKFKPKNKKPVQFKFTVENPPEQNDEDNVASSETERPAKKLRPAPVQNNDEEASRDETDHSDDIAADSNQQPAVDETEEAEAAPVTRHKYQTYYYKAKQASYEQIQDDYADAEPVTYTYRQNHVPTYSHRYVQSYQPRYYAGSSCHQNNNY
jgi:hypothetical protein